MAMKYVGSFTALLRKEGDRKSSPVATLLWGDPVHIRESAGDFVRVIARNRKGWVEAAALSDKSLLEMYVIDVGQGDGVLLKTPDGSWHLVDAGMASRDQMTRKGAANFLHWKFYRDLRVSVILQRSC